MRRIRANRVVIGLRGSPHTDQQSARTTFYAAALARHLPGITQLAADFQAEAWFEKLAEAGFDSARTTFFLWEAVTMYLDRSVRQPCPLHPFRRPE